MSTPNNDSWNKLKWLNRYLAGRPRAVSLFQWLGVTDVIDVYSDANWAGYKTSRKSTSGCWGSAVLKSYGETRSTIAQNSAQRTLSTSQ